MMPVSRVLLLICAIQLGVSTAQRSATARTSGTCEAVSGCFSNRTVVFDEQHCYSPATQGCGNLHCSSLDTRSMNQIAVRGDIRLTNTPSRMICSFSGTDRKNFEFDKNNVKIQNGVLLLSELNDRASIHNTELLVTESDFQVVGGGNTIVINSTIHVHSPTRLMVGSEYSKIQGSLIWINGSLGYASIFSHLKYLRMNNSAIIYNTTKHVVACEKSGINMGCSEGTQPSVLHFASDVKTHLLGNVNIAGGNLTFRGTGTITLHKNVTISNGYLTLLADGNLDITGNINVDNAICEVSKDSGPLAKNLTSGTLKADGVKCREVQGFTNPSLPDMISRLERQSSPILSTPSPTTQLPGGATPEYPKDISSTATASRESLTTTFFESSPIVDITDGTSENIKISTTPPDEPTATDTTSDNFTTGSSSDVTVTTVSSVADPDSDVTTERFDSHTTRVSDDTTVSPELGVTSGITVESGSSTFTTEDKATQSTPSSLGGAVTSPIDSTVTTTTSNENRGDLSTAISAEQTYDASSTDVSSTQNPESTVATRLATEPPEINTTDQSAYPEMGVTSSVPPTEPTTERITTTGTSSGSRSTTHSTASSPEHSITGKVTMQSPSIDVSSTVDSSPTTEVSTTQSADDEALALSSTPTVDVPSPTSETEAKIGLALASSSSPTGGNLSSTLDIPLKNNGTSTEMSAEVDEPERRNRDASSSSESSDDSASAEDSGEDSDASESSEDSDNDDVGNPIPLWKEQEQGGAVKSDIVNGQHRAQRAAAIQGGSKSMKASCYIAISTILVLISAEFTEMWL